MKKLVLFSLLLILAVVYSQNVFAWSDPVDISNSAGRSVRPAIVIDSKGIIHTFWNDNTLGNHDIYYSFKNGEAFSPPLQLTKNPGGSTRPAAVVDSLDTIRVVWYDYSPGNAEILYMSGRELSWSKAINISKTPSESLYPDIAIDKKNRIYVVWSDDASGNFDVWFKTSAVPHLSLNLSNNAGASDKPAIATDISDNIHVVWYDNTDTLVFSRIFYRKWNGESWTPIVNLSPPTGGSWRPDIATDSKGQVHVVFGHHVSENAEILYTKWDGSSWTVPMNISNTGGTSSHPSITVDKLDRVHVAWMDDTGSPNVFDVYYTRFDGSTWSVPINITNNPGDSQNPALAVNIDNTLHLVWYESVDGMGDIFYSMDPNP